jgi:predicted RNase H-like HicB family nuclease
MTIELHPVFQELSMLLNYVHQAMKKARYEIISDDLPYYGEIPGFDGIYAHAATLEQCRDELQEVLEEWILFRVSKNLALPVVDGIELAIREVA